MLKELLGGLVDKEQITHDTIQDALEKVAKELECDWTKLFIMIKPVSEEFSPKFYIYHTKDGAPKLVREITIKEILGT